MASKKVSSAADTPATDAQTPVIIDQVDAGTTAADPADNPTLVQDDPAPPAIPDPITALDEHGNERPLSGGSFIRQPDGTLTRNMEA